MTIDEFEVHLLKIVDSFDFNRPGEHGSLGRDVMNAVVEGIQTRSHDQKRGATTEWPKNATNYAKWKQNKYGVANAPNVRTGDMLSQRALRGRSVIGPNKITMIYGTNEVPKATSTGKPLPTKKRRGTGEVVPYDDLTDVQKAYFAHTGQGPNNVKRPFYEPDDNITADVRKIIDAALDDHIREANRR